MKSRIFMTGMIISLLVFGTVNLSARDFSKNFNPAYPIHGFALPNSGKTIMTRDLLLSDNFINTGNIQAVCEKAETKKDHFSMNLLLVSGFNRVARLHVTFKTSELTRQNYITYLEFFDFTAGKKESIDYNGTQPSMERITERYIELIDIFYNKEKLLS